MKTALLLSGGMDSIALAWLKRPDLAFTVDYGQLAAPAEIAASAAICQALEIPHTVLRFDARSLGSGDMAGAAPDAHAPASDWWPYRNQLLVTLVAMKAVALGVKRIWLGTVASDGSHKDGTSEFIEHTSRLLAYQEGGLVVEAPAIAMRTADLVRASGIPRSMLAWAHSCHKADVPCCNCRGCNKYYEVLQELDSNVEVAG
ncbi:7-cyano-7-deazaguanine synthase [Novilysobacter selenitireducens]|uniref:7-cyano-7-deazaguanine synthase n=1 Tax=Novilysobacter selenitireducens TaxID=2872639 RepID=A0ABS7T2H8_9GAMM|nr:7-cyano-7-deazaguanine synthase [Lysobacter selenitireducens]MBZ4038072.1 7-cyano-7-deazaguanine synthase [Lysobacter selenitireducens]